MSNETPKTDEELRGKFESYKEIFKSDDANEKFNATADMMRVVSSYLSKNVEGIDIWPITMVMAEYARIGQGVLPEFIKPANKNAGRSFIPLKNMHEASIVAAIQILQKHGFKLIEAFEFAATKSNFTVSQLRQLRKDFNRRKRMPEATQYLFEQSNLEFASQIELENYVLALIEMPN